MSVCIPTYAGASHIRDTIDSVLNQNLADFELLVVDDNSPDDTVAIVESYRDPRIRLLRNSRNLGPEGNWNRCLAEAHGKYFKLLPQDDLLGPTCLETQVSVLEKDADEALSMIFCTRNVIDSDGRKLFSRGYSRRARGVVPADELITRCIRAGANLIGEPGCVLFRRSLAESVGRFDASAPYVVDLDYWFRLLAHGDAYCIPDALASFRVSGSSWSVAIGKAQTQDVRTLIARAIRSPVVRASPLDATMGSMRAFLNTYLRLAIYRALLPRNRKPRAHV